MSRNFTILVLAASVGFARTAAADPFLSVPPASFINYHVDTVHQLSQQVAYDTVVRARLAHHFHMPASNMVAYIQDNLVLSHLQKPAQYRVACVTPSGHEYYVTERLPAGCAVFALKTNGQPILKRACGNPLVSSLPPVAHKHGGNRGGKPSLADTAATAGDPQDPGANTDPAQGELALAGPDLAGTDVGDLGPFTRVAGITQSLGSSGPGFGFPLAAAIGTAALFANHGGSNNSNPVPAPEPSTTVICGLGAAALGVLVLRRRRVSSVKRS